MKISFSSCIAVNVAHVRGLLEEMKAILLQSVSCSSQCAQIILKLCEI